MRLGPLCGVVVEVDDDDELELEAEPEESARLLLDGLLGEVAALAMSAAPTATPAASPTPIPAFASPRPTMRRVEGWGAGDCSVAGGCWGSFGT